MLQQSSANDPEIDMKLAELQNDMDLQAAAHTLPMDIKLYGDEETENHGNGAHTETTMPV